MKIQQLMLVPSRLLRDRRVRTASFAAVLALLINTLVNESLLPSLSAAPGGGVAKGATASPAPAADRARVMRHYGRLPMSFEVNRGQTDAQVDFLSRGRGYQVFLTPNEAVLSLKKPSANPTADPQFRIPGILRMKFVGADSHATLEGQEKLPGISNYFIGNDPKKWHTNIPNYRKVGVSQIYPGIDLVYYGQERQLEYDFVVAPGADPGTIRFALESGKSKLENRNPTTENGQPGASPEFVRIDANGDLVVALEGGEVRFHKPVVYQPKRSAASTVRSEFGIQNSELVDGHYVLAANNEVRFEVPGYDKTRPLVIDPVLSYSTYLGGSQIDAANAIAVSSDGSAFIAGETDSTNFPTAHALQPNAGGPFDFPDDAFVAKISSDGATLFYSTYLGGTADDRASGIAVDSFGAAYVTGTTISQDFPANIGAADPNCGNDGRCDLRNDLVASDAFATKLNPQGSAIAYSTFISHRGFVVDPGPPIVYSGANDRGFAIAVDLNGIAYVVGTTDVSDQLGPFSGSGNDTFLAKISASGSSFLFTATAGEDAADFGGAAEDQPFGVAVEDFSGSAYITGLTYSTNFPGCALSGDADALVMKIDTTQPVAGSILYSRCLGGAGRDQGNGIAVDAAGNAYVAGVTNSADFPTTPPVVKSPCTPEGDVFVSKFDSTASIVYSTCVGGSGADSGASVALDAATNAYVTGFTNSRDFPSLGVPFQPEYGGGNTDAYLFKLDPTGMSLVYSTYLGGSNAEEGKGVAVDLGENAYVAGHTCSFDFPTARAFQDTQGGNCDSFVAKVLVGPDIVFSPAALSFTAQTVGTTSAPKTITITSNGDTPLSITSVAVSGEFAAATDNCSGATLAVGETCTIAVTFSPSTPGPKTGTVTIADNALGSPHSVPLSGGTSGTTGGDFALEADPTAGSIAAGDSANFTLTVTPGSDFSGQVALTCTGVPSQATCTLTPASLTLSAGAAQTATVRVSTTARVMAPPAASPDHWLPQTGVRWAPWLLVLMLAGVVATASRRRTVLILASMMLVVMLWSACGGGGTPAGVPRGTPAGTYSVTVSGVSGSTSSSTTVMLTVN